MAMRIKQIGKSATFSDHKSLENKEKSDDFESWLPQTSKANENAPRLPASLTGAQTSLEDMLVAQQTDDNALYKPRVLRKSGSIYDKNPYEALGEPAPLERNTFQYVFEFIVIPPPQPGAITNRNI